MIIRQFLHQDPVGVSYLFGCGGRAAGAVVDPVGEIEPYLRAARRPPACAFISSSILTRDCRTRQVRTHCNMRSLPLAASLDLFLATTHPRTAHGVKGR